MADEIHVNREEEVGRRGGATAAYAGRYEEAGVADTALNTAARWGGIWAGFVTATSLFLWLALIGYAIFAPRTAGENLGTGFYVWTGIAYLIALYIGGVLLSQVGRIFNMGHAVWNGIALWGLNFTILLALMSIGAAGVVSALFGQNVTPEMGAGTASQALRMSISGAWWFVLFQFLALLAAVGGAVSGIKHIDEEEAHV